MEQAIQHGADVIIRDWVRLRAGERILIVSSQKYAVEVAAMQQAAQAVGSVADVLMLDDLHEQVGQYFDDREDAFDPYNAVIGAAEYSLITTRAVKRVIARRNRFLSLPLSTRNGQSLLSYDFLNMSLPKSRIMASIIMACYQNASHIHVTTELGTNLDFNIEGRVPGFFNGCCHDGKGLSSASVEVYVAPVESDTNGTLILDGSMVESAAAQYGPVSGSTSEYYVALKFNDEGAKAFGDATTELYQSSGTISIWLDDQNVSTATVNAAITDGAAIITSSASNPFTQEDVVKMARQINSGALPFALTVDSYSTVSPSLGENSLSAMVLAGLIAYALIVVLMTLLYRLPGFLACIALAGQVAATLAFVSGYFPVFESFTLTLPGIAGIILAIGMGVDANVITAERIKEELNNGKSLDGALKSGFARGLTPIIDGNVTIVIVAIVLMGAFGPSDGLFAKALHFVFFAFGPSTAGTIYAFGYTLLTGVLLNFVFGVFATRVMIRGAASIKALRNPWLYGAVKPGKEVKEKKPIDFVGLRKRFLTISTCLMAAIILCAAVFGVRLDTEFTGGAMITLSYQGEISTSEVQKTASTALENNGLTLQTGENVATGEQTLKISMPGNETVTTDQVENLLTSLNEQYPDNAFAQLSLSNVSAAMGTKFLQKSLVAVVFSLLLILLYIGFRFKKIGGLTGGMMAVLALLNDLMVVFGTFVLLRTPLDGNFIAAMLTILGYSINDTVVIYDRIRENSALYGKKQMSLAELVNLSVNQSFARSLMTSITTCLALGVVCVVSVIYRLDSIYSFAFPLLFGMVSGVYSTICIATPLWVDWKNKKKAAKKA